MSASEDFPGGGTDTGLELLRGTVPELMAWYDRVKRDLPWRRDPSPYRVWISEIMLQQTRIEAVRAYFDRFMEEFPDVRALAESDEERVLKLWEGLGYYSRARNLRRAAMVCEKLYGGNLPERYEDLKALPGIGPYTAGAVASIACGEPVPAVDGNVMRVVQRLLADDSDITRAGTANRIRKMLEEIIPRENPGAFNQALMELGETVCLPHGRPLCGECPLKRRCRAAAEGDPEKYPVRPPKKERRIEKRTILVIRWEGRCAIRRRPERGLLAGMYELPSVPGHLTAEEVENLMPPGMTGRKISPLPGARHLFSHIEWDMTGWLVEVNEEWKGSWFYARPEEIGEKYALPSAFRTYRPYI